MLIYILSLAFLFKTALPREVQEGCESSSIIEASYSLNESIAINKITTRDKIFITLKWIAIGRFWPEESTIYMINLERDDTVYMYKPFDRTALHDNKRIEIYHPSKSKIIKMSISFFKNEDDESRWCIKYRAYNTDVEPADELCKFFVKTDDTPFVTLEHHVIGKGRTIINKYNEDDKVQVTCTLNKGNPKNAIPEFNLVLPKLAKFEDISDERDAYSKIIVLSLTLNILKEVVYCYVTGGDSMSDSNILNFNIKKTYNKKTAETTVAISLAVFICILLLAVTMIGAYLLIVKQRKDTTKKLVQHHTHISQTRPVYSNMTNLSKFSKFSKLSKASRISRLASEMGSPVKTKEKP